MKLWEVGNILMDLSEEYGPLKVYFKTKDGERHEIKKVFNTIFRGEPTPIELHPDDGELASTNELILVLYYFQQRFNTGELEVRYMKDHPIDFIDYEEDGDFKGIVMRSYLKD